MNGEFSRALRTETSGTRVLHGGEFLEWNKGEDQTSLIWSSEKSLVDLISAVDGVLGLADSSHRGLVDFEDGQSAPETAETARRRALERPTEVTFLRLEYASGVSLVWTPSAGTEELERRSPYAEASIRFDRDHASLAVQTLGVTATRAMARAADTIVKSVAA